MTGSDLKDRVVIRRLTYDVDGDAFVWENEIPSWARVELDTRSNLFSSVGIGARGVTLTMRRSSRLTLYKALRWRGQHCFLTAITDADPGFVTVKAALCDPVSCRANMDKAEPGLRFPGVLTERYVGHEQPDLHAEVITDYVLVTPKAITLDPGSWVTAAGRYYRVLEPHELDPYKNEYVIRRKEDC